MNWHYVSAGQAVGPISAPELEKLVQSGVIQPGTLVWNPSMTEWKPYSSVKAAAASSLPPGATAEPQGLGAQPSPATQVGPEGLGERPVSGLPGAGGSLPSDADELFKLIQGRGYTLDIGACLNRSWELLKENFWLVVGATLLSSIIQQGGAMIPILGIALSGILMGGLYNFYIKLIRSQSSGIADIFSGFGPCWVQLMLVPIIQGAVMLVILGIGAIVIFGLWHVQRRTHHYNPLVFLITPIFLAPVIYLGLGWLFSLPLVIDRGLAFWPAMELSRKVIGMHWGSFFLMAILAIVFLFAGMMACIVGTFVALPLVFGMLMYAYEDVFGSGRALGA
jgi:hypothetical protein